jgi:hypothetical protein
MNIGDMNTVKTQKLGWLEPNDRFEIPSLTDTMRNLKVISTNASSTNIEGERRNGPNDLWQHFRFPISNDVNVVLVEKGAPLLKTEKPNKKSMNTQEQTTEANMPRRRGRPSKQGKSLNELTGVSGEFTVKDIVEKNDIKEYEAHNLVRSAVKSGKLQVVKEISGGRGKPKKVYRLA